jgi:uncharacterized membrane protein YqhA
MLTRLFSWSRYLIIIAVLGSLLASMLVMFFGVYDLVYISVQILQEGAAARDVAKKVAVGAIELVELFLLGTVLYVVGLGLYQLFINKDIQLPAWLEIATLDNLKERLLATVLVMLGVSFLGYAVTWNGDWNIIAIGAAIGIVIIGIAYTLAHAVNDKTEQDYTSEHEPQERE